MLQATVDKYTRLALDWEEAKRANPALELADHCASVGRPHRTVDRALLWYRRHFVELADSSKLKAAIIGLRERKTSLDNVLDRAIRGIRIYTRAGDIETIDASLSGIASLARAILAIETRILELEGLYKRVVNVQLEGRIEHRHYDLSRLPTERVIELRSILNLAATGSPIGNIHGN